MTHDSLLEDGERLTLPRPESRRRALGVVGTAPLGLYETPTGDTENLRLADMAERFGDQASLEALNALGVTQGNVVLDIGCGNSISLAQKMVGLDLTVVPTDIRPDAVTTHLRAGFMNARESSANCLMIGDDTIDASHARFTWGWLPPSEQIASLAEMIRVGKNDGTGIAIIDYDWSVCDGPKEFKDAINVITDLLREQGFDPDFGKKLPLNFGQHLGEVCVNPEQDAHVTMQRSPTYEGEISGALEDIIATAQPLIEGLAKIGKEREIQIELEKLQRFIAANPDAYVRLPDIVSVAARITEPDIHLTEEYFALEKISALRRDVTAPSPEPYRSGTDFVAAKENGRSGLVVAEGLRERLRKTQALAYLDAGIVTREAISAEGVLIEGINPQELIDRTDYSVALDETYTRIRGQAGTIRPNEKGVASLPFVQRVLEHSPESRALLESEGIFDPTKKVIEITGLAKNPIGGSFLDVIEAVVVLSKYNEENGVDIAVMSIDEKQASLMQRLFGEKNLRQFGDDTYIHGIGLPGVNNERRFVPLITNNDFLQRAEVHLKRLLSITERQGKSAQFYEDILRLIRRS